MDRYHTRDGSTHSRQAPGTSNLCMINSCVCDSLVNVASDTPFTLGALDENLVPSCFKRLPIVYMEEWECR